MSERASVPGTRTPSRVIVAITGASGAIYGVRLLEVLRETEGAEVHLVVSKAGAATLRHELGIGTREVAELADVTHPIGAIGASIASGSFPMDAMFVAPCSVRTLSAIATSYSSDLVCRAADVTLKEGRPLVLLVRETPLHLGHLRLMTAAAELGAVIAPPVPAFYSHPATIDDIVDHTVRRLVARAGIPVHQVSPWQGLADAEPSTTRSATVPDVQEVGPDVQEVGPAPAFGLDRR